MTPRLTEAQRKALQRSAWIRGELDWKLHSTQRKIDAMVKGTEGEVLILCSRQLGKSWWSIKHALEYCIKNPGSIVRIAADTLKQINDIVNDNLEPFIADAPKGFIRRKKSSNRWEVGFQKGPNGRYSQIRLGCLARAHVDTLRGGNAALVIAEEGGFVPSEEYRYAIESVIGAQLLRSGGRLIHVTTPSEDLLHYVHSQVLPDCMQRSAVARFTIYDNPQLTPVHIAKAIKLARGEHTDTWKREFLAMILPIRDRLIVPEWASKLPEGNIAQDLTKHPLVKELEHLEHARYWLSGDFGGQRDKHSFLLWRYDFKRGKKQVIAECEFEKTTPTIEIVAGIKSMELKFLPGCYVDEDTGEHVVPQWYCRWLDAAGQTLVDLNTKPLELYCMLPIKDDKDAALHNLRDAIYNEEIEVHPRCRFLITSLTSGMWNPKRTDWERTEALGHCDAIAAMVYGNRQAMTDNPYPLKRLNTKNQIVVKQPVENEVKIAAVLGGRTFR